MPARSWPDEPQRRAVAADRSAARRWLRPAAPRAVGHRGRRVERAVPVVRACRVALRPALGFAPPARRSVPLWLAPMGTTALRSLVADGEDDPPHVMPNVAVYVPGDPGAVKDTLTFRWPLKEAGQLETPKCWLETLHWQPVSVTPWLSTVTVRQAVVCA